MCAPLAIGNESASFTILLIWFVRYPTYDWGKDTSLAYVKFEAQFLATYTSVRQLLKYLKYHFLILVTALSCSKVYYISCIPFRPQLHAYTSP
jgi:hypothetical protein